jgi:hypothetical protein
MSAESSLFDLRRGRGPGRKGRPGRPVGMSREDASASSTRCEGRPPSRPARGVPGRGMAGRELREIGVGPEAGGPRLRGGRPQCTGRTVATIDLRKSNLTRRSPSPASRPSPSSGTRHLEPGDEAAGRATTGSNCGVPHGRAPSMTAAKSPRPDSRLVGYLPARSVRGRPGGVPVRADAAGRRPGRKRGRDRPALRSRG